VAGHHLAVVAAVFQVEVGVLGVVEVVVGGELPARCINDHKRRNNSSPSLIFAHLFKQAL
jgi:hypothetical protein